ncbi:protein-tyrosine phosphatase-like protein [Nemania diffusa]|nr:protein-tyrosine phosphatase-like protein [Nemania diffusa]
MSVMTRFGYASASVWHHFAPETESPSPIAKPRQTQVTAAGDMIEQLLMYEPMPPQILGATPTAPYSRTTPSVPLEHPPAALDWHRNKKIVPRWANIDPSSLTRQQLAVITQDRVEQVAHDVASTWTYASRREAHPVLEYLYLGPSNVARNRQWLKEKGITMIMGVRDTRQVGSNIMAYHHIAEEMHIEARYVDVSGSHELASAFPAAIRIINEHMLDIYHSQSVRPYPITEGSTMMINEDIFERGRILVFCETGNERSASVVCAYLMSILGMPAVEAYQFLSCKRFCVSLDDTMKQILKAYEDILAAERMVHKFENDANPVLVPPRGAKRAIEETVDVDDNGLETSTDQTQGLDSERDAGRRGFQPFIDN